ncbi:hypothetical protein M9435_006583 [Picochlorum sp. BPE23]|nr:hypothetical protein M9435_006583 [Picochlorum sp. BPE23]
MNDEDEFGKSPLGVSSKQRTQLPQHKNIDENEEGRGRRALNFSEATGTQQGKDESTFGEQDLYGDLYGAGEGGDQKEGVGILRLKVSRLMSDIGVKDSMISRLEKTVQELQEEVGRLKESNKVLEYNISSLFNTAKLEIERKDAEIKSLRSTQRR